MTQEVRATGCGRGKQPGVSENRRATSDEGARVERKEIRARTLQSKKTRRVSGARTSVRESKAKTGKEEREGLKGWRAHARDFEDVGEGFYISRCQRSGF